MGLLKKKVTVCGQSRSLERKKRSLRVLVMAAKSDKRGAATLGLESGIV